MEGPTKPQALALAAEASTRAAAYWAAYAEALGPSTVVLAVHPRIIPLTPTRGRVYSIFTKLLVMGLCVFGDDILSLLQWLCRLALRSIRSLAASGIEPIVAEAHVRRAYPPRGARQFSRYEGSRRSN